MVGRRGQWQVGGNAAELYERYHVPAIVGPWAADVVGLALPHPRDFSWNRFPQAEAVTYFARALEAARSGNAADARKEIARLDALRAAPTSRTQPKNTW